QVVEEGQQARVEAGPDVRAAQQRHAAVELPARQEDGALRLERGLDEGAVVVLCVDEDAARVDGHDGGRVFARVDDDLNLTWRRHVTSRAKPGVGRARRKVPGLAIRPGGPR